MFHSNKPRIPDLRADYAQHADFCDVFGKDTKPLYLLAFLLTANHKESEQCFVSTVEDVLKEPAVFKEWARSWVKRRLIEIAIEIVSPASARNGQKRDLWSAAKRETKGECEIDTVTKLAALERFVFVMSILERYSNWDCALLLGCGMNKLAQARMRALRRLADLAALFARATIIGSQQDMLLVAQASNALEAVTEFRHHRPDITLMDLRLPGTDGTDALIAIRGEFPHARVIMLTTSDGDGDIQRAMRAGASAYILKSMPKNELLGVIRSVQSGRRHVPAEVAARLAEHLGDDDLTTRELEVLRLIRDGCRNKQIADQLAIAETTVNFHIKNLVDKLGANDRTHAVTIALRRGLLQM